LLGFVENGVHDGHRDILQDGIHVVRLWYRSGSVLPGTDGQNEKAVVNSMERKFSGSGAYTGRESGVAGEVLSLYFLRVCAERQSECMITCC
jgi:hypothetical protein